MTAPGGPAPAHSAAKMAPSDLPEGSGGLQEEPLDPPEAAKGSPEDAQRGPRDAQGAQEGAKGAQEGSKRAQVGSKVGPQMGKVAKVTLKKTCVFLLFRASRASQDDPPRTPNGALRPKRTSKRAQKNVKTAR